MKLKTRRRIMWLAIIIFAVVAPPIVLYTTGWRLTTDLKFKRTGGLFVAVPESGAEVYIDGELRRTTNFLQSGVFIQNLTPTAYSILVAKDGFWPWTKKLSVEESSVVESRALMLPQTVEGKAIIRGRFQRVFSADKNSVLLLEEEKGGRFTFTFYLPESNEFLTAGNSKVKNLLGSQEKLRSLQQTDDGVILIFEQSAIKTIFDYSTRTVSAQRISSADLLEDNLPALPHKIAIDEHQRARAWHDTERKIWVEWLSQSPLPYYLEKNKVNIFEARSPIKSLAFFPKRNDILLAAIENGVFALEIDGRGTRNFQPIYKGRDPSFARLGNTIYVLDQGALSKIEP